MGRSSLDDQAALNELFCKFGSSTYAVIVGVLSFYGMYNSIFYTICIMSIVSTALVASIIPSRVDSTAARGLHCNSEGIPSSAMGYQKFLYNPNVFVLLVTVFLFHLANAAMLPLLSQYLSLSSANNGIVISAANISIAQSVQAITALFVGFNLSRWSHKRIFVVGLLILPIRGIIICVLLKSAPNNVACFIATQIFDGLAHGVYNVMSIVISEKLADGSGRFSFLLGAVQTSHCVGDAFSHLVGEIVADHFGYMRAFQVLTMFSILPSVIYMYFMPNDLLRNHFKCIESDLDISLHSTDSLQTIEKWWNSESFHGRQSSDNQLAIPISTTYSLEDSRSYQKSKKDILNPFYDK